MALGRSAFLDLPSARIFLPPCKQPLSVVDINLCQSTKVNLSNTLKVISVVLSLIKQFLFIVNAGNISMLTHYKNYDGLTREPHVSGMKVIRDTCVSC